MIKLTPRRIAAAQLADKTELRQLKAEHKARVLVELANMLLVQARHAMTPANRVAVWPLWPEYLLLESNVTAIRRYLEGSNNRRAKKETDLINAAIASTTVATPAAGRRPPLRRKAEPRAAPRNSGVERT